MTLFKNRLNGKQYGEYKIIQFLSEGRFGICYVAANNDNRHVVVKRFKSIALKNIKQQLTLEAVLLSQINHPAIPKLLGVINEKQFYAYVLELKSGDTLAQLLFSKYARFDAEEIFNIGLQLIRIVSYLHHKGIVHRDISLANVLYDKGEVSLIDFGLSHWADHHLYCFDSDFSYIGDLLLYLIYSTQQKPSQKKLSWYEELNITCNQKLFLKRMLRLEKSFLYIDEVEEAFISAFQPKAYRQ